MKKLILLITILVIHNLYASWYYLPNKIMANGKEFKNDYTCATRLFPLGTILIVTNLENNKKVRVEVTDRINKRFAKTRIDLSQKAFSALSSLSKGLIPCKITKSEGYGGQTYE